MHSMASMNSTSQSDEPCFLTFNVDGKDIVLFPVLPLSRDAILYDVDGLPGIQSLILPEVPVDGGPIIARCRDGVERHGTWNGDLQRSMDGLLQAHPALRYRSDNFVQTEGLTLSDLTLQLHQVHQEYPEYHDPDLGSGRFDDMVDRFAGDPFYKLHHVAIAYGEMTRAAALSDEERDASVAPASTPRPRPR